MGREKERGIKFGCCINGCCIKRFNMKSRCKLCICFFPKEDPGKGRPEQNWMDCLKDDFQAFGATDGSTVDNRLTFGVDRAVWTLAAKMDDGAPWHKGVLQGAEKFMASWHKEEEEASRRRATKRDSRDLEPPTHL